MGGPVELQGPDLTQGVPIASLEAGKLLGHAGGEPVLVVRSGGELFAISATCTHYSGPLAEGILEGDTITCPLHHACFSVRTGEPSAPAFNPIACFAVATRGDRVFVGDKLPPAVRTARVEGPKRVVILGGGAAGHAAAETLRREGFAGAITLISADDAAPYDRPNASKDYLAGNAPEEWMPMRPASYYEEARIELLLGRRATSIDTAGKRVVLAQGEPVPFDALLLATGAEPIRLAIPGADLPHVRYVRTLADSRAIIARAKDARRALVLGASFIGLEVAAALRARGVEVHVAAPDRPLERVLGPDLSAFVRALHEEKGVVFHLGTTASEIRAGEVHLSDGTTVPADLVVAGIGVRPAVQLMEAAGLKVDRGVVVGPTLETSVPGIFAAGDVARWTDEAGRSTRVEHWVVAQRQGQTAARNLLGAREPFRDVPFFWSQHYDVAINYVGHAERWDRAQLVGSLAARKAIVGYRDGGELVAVATVGHDLASLRAEQALRRKDHAALEALLGDA